MIPEVKTEDAVPAKPEPTLEPEYIVEKILDEKWLPDGKKNYLIKVYDYNERLLIFCHIYSVDDIIFFNGIFSVEGLCTRFGYLGAGKYHYLARTHRGIP